MIKIDLKRHRKEIIGSVVVLLILLGGMSVFKYTSFNSGFEIVDDLGEIYFLQRFCLLPLLMRR